MGVSVSLHHTPVLEVVTGEAGFVMVGMNSCPDPDCKNHMKEMKSKFCSDCGSKIDVVMCQEEISEDFIIDDSELCNIESTAYSMCFYDYDFCDYNGDCLESEYKLLSDKSEDDKEMTIERFKEKYASKLKELEELELDYEVKFRIFTSCG